MTEFAVKICGIRDVETAVAAAAAGADYLGFVFFRKSPRYLSPEDADEIVLALREESFEKGFDLPGLVGLFVDAGEKEIAETAGFLTHIQFHGREPAERCEEISGIFGVEVIKALPIGGDANFDLAAEYAEVADMLLFDAKPPPGATRPGGHGDVFDWTLLREYSGETPFLLAGGLTPDNAADAISVAKKMPGFMGLDVSSGVERAPGEKDEAKIAAFIKAVRDCQGASG